MPAGGLPLANPRREARLLWILVAIGVVIALGTAATRFQANPFLAVMAGLLVVAAWHRRLLAWPTVVGYVAVVILFVPIRRYSMAAALPVNLEPYRVLIAVVLLAWLFALLGDPRARLQRMRLEAPVVGVTVAMLISIALNLERITDAGITAEVVKSSSFLVSFIVVMYFVTSVVTTRRHLDGLLMLLVGGATLLALAAVVEWRTSYNPFHHLERVMPVLRVDPEVAQIDAEMAFRGERTRAMASAQHPIALGAALVLMLPIAIYLFRRRQQLFWLGCAGALTFGALATGSRTAILMLVAELLVFLWLKRRETVRLLPLLLPLILACHIVVPGSIGTFKSILFPEGGLIEEQKRGDGGVGSGRIADLGPSLDEFSQTPFFGQGFGTRLSSQSDVVVNAKILDNEWLGLMLEVGAIGALCLLWLFVRAVRLLARAGKRDDSPYGVLLAALAASIVGFAAGMLTFDAFSFIQVTVLTFVLLGLAAVALRLGPEEESYSTSTP